MELLCRKTLRLLKCFENAQLERKILLLKKFFPNFPVAIERGTMDIKPISAFS